jgi:prepilin peptidase CpaA
VRVAWQLRGLIVTDTIHYGLLIALAIALVVAAFTDIRSRTISNWLNGAIALGAPLFWWSSGLALWPDIALQIGVAVAAFAVFAGLFALKMMGGGDVKLLTVLALWVSPVIFMQLLVVMALAGGLLTVLMVMWHTMRRQKDKLAIPYGVAIAFGGLWVLAANYLPGAAIAAQAA